MVKYIGLQAAYEVEFSNEKFVFLNMDGTKRNVILNGVYYLAEGFAIDGGVYTAYYNYFDLGTPEYVIENHTGIDVKEISRLAFVPHINISSYFSEDGKNPVLEEARTIIDAILLEKEMKKEMDKKKSIGAIE